MAPSQMLDPLATVDPHAVTAVAQPQKTCDEDDLLPYAPHEVPPADRPHPSFRDDVRRTLRRHSFRPSRSRYTDISHIYALFLKDHSHAIPSADTDLKFRSALGRVLRPPATADDFARSYAVPSVRRVQGFISIVSPVTPAVDLLEHMRELKRVTGISRRCAASQSDSVGVLQEQRRVKRLNAHDLPEETPAPQSLSYRYVDEFMSLNCAEDLLKLKIFPNGKEMAESMSAYAAVREHLHQDELTRCPISFDDTNVKLLAVGDGCTPRTACLFAFRTRWQCVSVDPLMRKGTWDAMVSNVRTHRARIQDVSVPLDHDDQRMVVIMWHAHVSIRDALSCIWNVDDHALSARMRSRVALVSCACCNYDREQREMPDGSLPDAEYEDIAVPGDKRVVRVWKFIDQTVQI